MINILYYRTYANIGEVEPISAYEYWIRHLDYDFVKFSANYTPEQAEDLKKVSKYSVASGDKVFSNKKNYAPIGVVIHLRYDWLDLYGSYVKLPNYREDLDLNLYSAIEDLRETVNLHLNLIDKDSEYRFLYTKYKEVEDYLRTPFW